MSTGIVHIVPIGEISESVISLLATKLMDFFHGIQFQIYHSIPIPKHCLNPLRGQYKAECVLKAIPNTKGKALGVIDEDLYVPNLNFVFGVATSTKAIIALPRLRNEFYGMKGDEKLFLLRVLKEAIHELGHSFGLSHCPNPKCVMHFSNSILDTDIKGPDFCDNCKKKLHKLINF